MATSPRNAVNFTDTSEDTDIIQKPSDKLLSFSAEHTMETEMLRSRIDEQSNLICMQKERADELLLRCEALQKINTELEDSVTDCKKELDDERKKAALLEERFMDLAANNQGIIVFMEEYKNQNAKLKMENKQLQSENDTLFSQKLHDKEVRVQKLMQDMKLLTEKSTSKYNEYQQKLAENQSKHLEHTAQHKAKEASLLNQLHDIQQQERDAVEAFKDMTLKLKMAEEKHDLKESYAKERITSLIKEKDKFLSLSIQRGTIIQAKQGEIQELERKLKEEKKHRVEAEDRFHQEAEAVDADIKVKSLKCVLDESERKYEKLKKEFEAFREHSTSLLSQERELNKKLCHMIG
ncbi:coiled-coil domain-containing protein 89 [Echeneis naucrates]|uniref:coiled-coil domain-containing protein 89 n=1 Tax=Echeneis naucrates TaxID=173247 RepID=UPI0011145052|nr:coiled-coil domain-containing protein 89 [Echeneis naucrates]